MQFIDWIKLTGDIEAAGLLTTAMGKHIGTRAIAGFRREEFYPSSRVAAAIPEATEGAVTRLDEVFSMPVNKLSTGN